MDREKIFEDRKAAFSLKLKHLNQRYNLFSGFRVTTFLLMLILAIYFANTGAALAVTIILVVFFLVFGLLVNKHQKITQARTNCQNHIVINDQELLRLSGNFQTLDEGKEHLAEQHFYAKDLDVFGRNSLFQLLNRTNTPTGRNILAGWLKKKVDRSTIELRQEAVKELTEQVDWRQQYESSGMMQSENSTNFNKVIAWVNEPPELKGSLIMRMLSYILPIIMLVALGLVIFGVIHFYVLIGLGVINGVLIRKYSKKVTDITESTGESLSTLKAYGYLIHIIERAAFKSALLKQLQNHFLLDKQSASVAILRLQKILQFLYARNNMLYGFINLLLLFDVHLYYEAQKWKKKHQREVENWFECIGEIEAINSLAGFAFANPNYTFPELKEQPFIFEAQKLGHPLIHSSERVNNDFTFKGEGSIALVTGSNMSGKSTFLRSVGVNMVLAYAGAPVCAESLKLSLMQLFTGMRTEDNLEEHISSFYAELQRIKMLLQLVKNSDVPVMFMLDEILKGTNSNDRHAGAQALIRQLAQHKIMGFVSTHDLVLGQLADELEGLENYSFNSLIEGDRIIFDYKIENGLCHSFNASKLMEQIGIDLNLNK